MKFKYIGDAPFMPLRIQGKFEVVISKALVEVNGFELEVEIAIVDEKIYPERAPMAIIGRDFLNEHIITLNGEEICIERKNKEKTK